MRYKGYMRTREASLSIDRDAWQARAEKAEAEVVALRKALEEIAKTRPLTFESAARSWLYQCVQIARAALATGKADNADTHYRVPDDSSEI